MPDSVGAGGFPRNINIGHEHLDLSSGFTYQYQGGVPTDVLNWKIINGVSATDPSPLGWGTKQLGAMWFNSTIRQWRGWNGIQITSMLSEYERDTLYRSGIFLEDDFISGNATNGQIGALGWGTSNGTTITSPSIPSNIGIIQKSTGAVANTVASIQLLHLNNAAIDASLNHTITFIVRPTTVDADIEMRIGMSSPVVSNPPLDGIYFEKLSGDTTWFGAIIRAGVSSRINTGIPITTDFATFSYNYNPTRNSVIFSYNNEAVGENFAALPLLLIDPFVHVINLVGAEKIFQLDYFQLKVASGLNRL